MYMLWNWVSAPGYYKSHGVPEFLTESLLDDLRTRVPDAEPEIEGLTACFIDQPGMVFSGRPTMTFSLDGLSITIPSEDVGPFANQLKKLKQRTFSLKPGFAYYKLHGFHKCLVLTPDQRVMLMEQLMFRAEEGQREMNDFFEQWKRETWK